MKLLHSSKMQSQSMKKETKQTKQLISTLLALLIAFTAVFAVPQQTEAATKKLTLTKSKVTLYAGEYTTIKVKSATGLKNKKVTYKTSKKSVATVSSKGVVTAKKKGTATITVTSVSDKKVKATFKVTVKAKPKKSAITLTKKKVNVKVGKTAKIKVKKFTGVSSKAVSYKSSNKKIATVNSKGIITGKKKGTAKITVRSKVNKRVKAVLTVNVTGTSANTNSDTNIPVQNIDVVSEITLQVNEGMRVPVTITPSNATNKKYTMTSANVNVAVISGTNGILATGVGKTTVTVKSDDGKVTKKIKVNVVKKTVKTKSITFTGMYGRTRLCVPTGAKYKYQTQIEVLPTNVSNKVYEWSSSNTSIAKVDQNGVITGIKPGECKITVKACDGSEVAKSVVVYVDYGMTVKEACEYLLKHPKEQEKGYFRIVMSAEEFEAFADVARAHGATEEDIEDEKYNSFWNGYYYLLGGNDVPLLGEAGKDLWWWSPYPDSLTLQEWIELLD